MPVIPSGKKRHPEIKKRRKAEKMNENQSMGSGIIGKDSYEYIIKEVITGISETVQKKYHAIDLRKIPDHVSYSKVEKYLRSVNIEVTRKMLFSYLAENLVPPEQEIKNSRYSYYTKEQIIYYILIDMFKPILPLSKVKVLFHDMLKPMIIERGLETTYRTLCGLITYMVDRFDETVTTVIRDTNLNATDIALQTMGDDEESKALSYIVQYTNLVTLCMAKGALDFYKHSPNTLLE